MAFFMGIFFVSNINFQCENPNPRQVKNVAQCADQEQLKKHGVPRAKKTATQDRFSKIEKPWMMRDNDDYHSSPPSENADPRRACERWAASSVTVQ